MIERLREVIAAIAASPDGACLEIDVAHILTLMADRAQSISATKHPLGFIHAELTPLVPSIPAGTRVRLHIWKDPVFVADELGLIHDHIWSLKSCVLMGVLTDVTLEPIASPEGEYVGFRVGYGETNQFRLEGRWCLTESTRRSISAGQVYSLQPRIVHRTEVSIFPLVTLLVTVDKKDGGPGPMVYSRRAKSTGTSIRASVHPTALANLLGSLGSRLEPF